MGAFMIITLPSEEEMTVDVARSGMPSWGLPDIVKELALVMILDGEIEANQPKDEHRGRREVWKSNSLKVQGYAGGWSM